MTISDHFMPEDWVDFVRKTAPVDRQVAIQRHLDEGCRHCAEQHFTWNQVVSVARSEGRYEMPAGTLRVAKASYQAPKPAPKQEGRLARAMQAAGLLFDSRLAPVPIGIRSASAAPRRLLYASGSMLVDLQVERSTQTRKTVLIGQVTSSADRGRPVEGVQILVLDQARVIAKAGTSRLGEFHVEFESPTDDFSLALGFQGDESVMTLGSLTKVQS